MADIKVRVGQENAVRISASIAGGADKAYRSTNVDGGYADVTTLNVSGISTLSSLLVNGTSDFVGVSSFQNNVYIDDDLILGGYLKVGGTSEFIGITTFRGGTINLGDSTSDGINIAGEFISHLIPDANGTYNLGKYDKQWNNAWFSGITSTSYLTVNNTSSFLGDVVVNANLSIGSGHFEVESAVFSGITTFTDTAYFNEKVGFNTTSSIRIPVGTTSQRDGAGAEYDGLIRYNTTISDFEGYGAGGQWNVLGGVSDIDKDTYIKAEDDRANASDEDVLTFVAGGSVAGTISSTRTEIKSGKLDLTPANGSDTAYINGPSQILIDPAPLFGSHTSEESVRGTVRIKGDLYVDGTKFEVESTTVNIADYRIGIGTTATDDIVLDGAGIGIGSIGFEKTFTWDYDNRALSSSEHINIVENKVYKIGGLERLSENKLTFGANGENIEIFDSNNDLVVNVNQEEKLRLKNGNLGIGTTNPLQSIQIGAANTLGISTDHKIFVVTSVGDVGIGTATPTSDLDVRGNVNIVGYATVTEGLYYQTGDFDGPNGITYFNNSGKLVGAPSTESQVETSSNYILTTDNQGIPVWTSTIDGGTYD